MLDYQIGKGFLKVSEKVSIHKEFEEKTYSLENNIVYIPISKINKITAKLDNLSLDSKCAGLYYDVLISYEDHEETKLRMKPEEFKEFDSKLVE